MRGEQHLNANLKNNVKKRQIEGKKVYRRSIIGHLLYFFCTEKPLFSSQRCPVPAIRQHESTPTHKRRRPLDFSAGLGHPVISQFIRSLDSLKTLNELMGDPLRRSLDEAMAQMNPRNDPENPGSGKD